MRQRGHWHCPASPGYHNPLTTWEASQVLPAMCILNHLFSLPVQETSYRALMTTKCNELRSIENAIYLSSPGTILHTGPCDHKYLPSKLHIINKNANIQPWWHLSRHLQLPPELHSHMYTCSKPGVCGSSFSGFPLFQSLRYSEIRCSIINTVVSLLFKDKVSDPQVHLYTYRVCVHRNLTRKYLNFYTCKPGVKPVSFTRS